MVGLKAWEVGSKAVAVAQKVAAGAQIIYNAAMNAGTAAHDPPYGCQCSRTMR